MERTVEREPKDVCFSSGSITNKLWTFNKSFSLHESQFSSSVKWTVKLSRWSWRSLTCQPDPSSRFNSQYFSDTCVTGQNVPVMSAKVFTFRILPREFYRCCLFCFWAWNLLIITLMLSILFLCHLYQKGSFRTQHYLSSEWECS